MVPVSALMVPVVVVAVAVQLLQLSQRRLGWLMVEHSVALRALDREQLPPASDERVQTVAAALERD